MYANSQLRVTLISWGFSLSFAADHSDTQPSCATNTNPPQFCRRHLNSSTDSSQFYFSRIHFDTVTPWFSPTSLVVGISFIWAISCVSSSHHKILPFLRNILRETIQWSLVLLSFRSGLAAQNSFANETSRSVPSLLSIQESVLFSHREHLKSSQTPVPKLGASHFSTIILLPVHR